jgi:hypothetical protein
VLLVIKEKGIFFFKVEFILFSRFSIADRLSREHFGLGSSKNQLPAMRKVSVRCRKLTISEKIKAQRKLSFFTDQQLYNGLKIF